MPLPKITLAEGFDNISSIHVVGCNSDFVIGKDQRLLSEAAKEFHYRITDSGPRDLLYSCSFMSFPDLYDRCIRTFHWTAKQMKSICEGETDMKEEMKVLNTSKQAVMLCFVKSGASRMKKIVRKIRDVSRHDFVTINNRKFRRISW